MATLSIVHDRHEGTDRERPLRPVSARRTAGPTVSVCLPARNEEASIGGLVGDIDRHLVRPGIFDEVIVIDDRSEDFTAAVARVAGARVVAGHDILPSFGPGLGKGDAMWRSLAVAGGDIVIWCDADLRSFDVRRLDSLVQPFLDNPRIHMVKGYFSRLADDGTIGPGGRVTELVARPLLTMLFPDTSHIREPLGGIYAMRRESAMSMPFEPDYGVDVGLLIDTIARWGRAGVTQVDLGNLSHRHQPLEGLALQSIAVQRAILSRAYGRLSSLGSRPRLGGAPVPVRPPLRDVSLLELDALCAAGLR